MRGKLSVGCWLITALTFASASFLTAKTPPGKRAVTVMIESLNAVGGLLNAGDFVDVIAHLDIPEGTDKKKTITAMVFQDSECHSPYCLGD